jgi:hypothetical protein
MSIRKAYRHRLCLNHDQKTLFALNFGHTLFMPNYFLTENPPLSDKQNNDPKKRERNFYPKVNPRTEMERDPKFEGLGEEHSLVPASFTQRSRKGISTPLYQGNAIPEGPQKLRQGVHPLSTRFSMRGKDLGAPSLVCCQ